MESSSGSPFLPGKWYRAARDIASRRDRFRAGEVLRFVEQRMAGTGEATTYLFQDLEHGTRVFDESEGSDQDGASLFELVPGQLLTCEHLRPLERDLRDAGVTTQWEGLTWWQGGSRGMWIFFEVRLDPDVIRQRYALPAFVEHDEWDGRVMGAEAGFTCTQCESAIKGLHPVAHASQRARSFP